MIVLDSSAVLSVLLREADAEWFLRKLRDEMELVIAAPTLVECAIVMRGDRFDENDSRLKEFLAIYNVRVVDFTFAQAVLAVDAFAKYGRQRHKADLNFGDCMSYAAAKSFNAPILCKGNDFAQTDLATLSPE